MTTSSINPAKRVILVGERRRPEWPDHIPSIPHPLLVRLEARGDHENARAVVFFEPGETGYEAFYVTEKLRTELAQGERPLCLCAGGMGWSSLTVDSKETARAIEALLAPGEAVWTAHVSTPRVGGGYDETILRDETGALTMKDARAAKRHFETMLGLDPDRDLLKAMFDKTPRPFVDEVILAPSAWGPMPHWGRLEQTMRAAEQASGEAYRQHCASQAKKDAQAGFARRAGTLVLAPQPVGRDDTAGVRGELRAADGTRHAYIAFGEPGQQLARLKAGAAVELGGTISPHYGNKLKVSAVRVVARAAERDGVAR